LVPSPLVEIPIQALTQESLRDTDLRSAVLEQNVNLGHLWTFIYKAVLRKDGSLLNQAVWQTSDL